MNESYELPCKKYGVNWANSVVCDGKMNNNLRFLCIQRKTETIRKYRILFVEVYEAGSDRSVKTVGNPAGAAVLQNGAFPAKITLP